MSEATLRTLVDELLLDQQQLTAVERFSQRYEKSTGPVQEKFYRDLIPIRKPGTGEQYAFEVDLDACSGCKACVSACHSLNGLDEGESWRDVGGLMGGENGTTMQQTVTTACHHCEDPACANGCPTKAYEKDADTGIVRHLDDQCIGCRYCELKCPYEVPKYNDRLGIVRKCDMCHGRLAEGEAPACVQACPNEAIRIRVVSREEVSTRSGPEDQLLPGTVSSDYTRPTTVFLNQRNKGTPMDKDTIQPAHGHYPLVWMLAATQVGTGLLWALAAGFILKYPMPSYLPWLAVGMVLLGIVGSVFHLGQPTKAWKAFLGWKTSWLSREIMVFGGIMGSGAALVASLLLNFPAWVTLSLSAAAAVLGGVGIWTSVMVYADTQRQFWHWRWNTYRFFGTALAAAFLFSPIPALALGPGLFLLGLDASIFRGRVEQYGHAHHLYKNDLFQVYLLRIFFGLVAMAGFLFPLFSVSCLLLSELCARILFFRAVDEPGMPGGLKT